MIDTRWFHKGWYEYLFEKPRDPDYCGWLKRIWCRMHGHPCGVWFYRFDGGLEPDMHCKDCGDDLG
jgi:hypothetical protein